MRKPEHLLYGILIGAAACTSPGHDSTQLDLVTDAGAFDADPNEPPPEPLLEAHRYFTCDPDGMAAEMVVAEVAERAGDQIVIGKTAAPCQVNLVYRSATTGDTALSAAPNGYLLVEAVDRLVCGSVIANTPVIGEEPKHEITEVPIDCALQDSGGSWSPLTRVVDPPALAWAAWIRDMRKSGTDTYVITYVRDFTYQFLNLSDNGRAASDGVYEVTVSIAGDAITVLGTTKISDSTTDVDVEDPTPGCPDGQYDADNPLCANAQYPGQAQAGGTATGTDIGWNYNMGYRFTPTADGVVSALGGLYNGTKTVRLYDYATGTILASAAHTSANEFDYTGIAPVPLAADATYVVAADMAGSGAAYEGPNPAGATYGDVRIDCPGVYRYGSTAMPTNCSTSYYYGLADVEFRAGAGTFCGDGTCDALENCASCAADCGACAPPQYPGFDQFDGSAAATGIGWNYNMGHRFTPLVDGAVTGLGGHYNGTKTVRLYDFETGYVLASTAHTSADAFSYTQIPSITTLAGTTYVVAVELAGSGGAYDGPYSAGAIYGDVMIDCPGVYRYNSTDMPTNCTTYYYGMADVEFRR